MTRYRTISKEDLEKCFLDDPRVTLKDLQRLLHCGSVALQRALIQHGLKTDPSQCRTRLEETLAEFRG